MWVFGYGSLIWKVDFPTVRKHLGYIKGYERRFWQASTDHRGVPGKPGRVPMLVEADDPETKLWGMSHLIDDNDTEAIAKLQHREKQYAHRTFMFYPRDQNVDPFEVSCYIGPISNDLLLGPDSLENMAKQISECAGPSGTNADYLFELANALRRELPGVNDKHVFSLEKEVRKIIESKEKNDS